jgi:hypothetical protein
VVTKSRGVSYVTLPLQTSNMEGVLREKETKLAESEKASERKNELHERLKKAKEDEEQVSSARLPSSSSLCVLFTH